MNEDRTKARQIAAEVAEHLDGFTYTEAEVYGGLLKGEGDAELFFRIESFGASKGRLSIFASYPGTHDQRYGFDRHEIGVNPERGATVIAREIARRLLPDYLSDLAKVRERIAKDEANTLRRAEVGGEIAALMGSEFKQHDSSAEVSWPSRYDGYGRIKLNHDGSKADIDLSYLPIEVVRAAVEAAARAAGRTGN